MEACTTVHADLCPTRETLKSHVLKTGAETILSYFIIYFKQDQTQGIIHPGRNRPM